MRDVHGGGRAAREAASADKAAAEGASASTLKNVASTLVNASTPVKVVGGILVLAGVACGGVKLYSTSVGTRPTQRVNENPGRLGASRDFPCLRAECCRGRVAPAPTHG